MLAEVLARHLRQVELDRAVQHFDIIAQATHLNGHGGLFALQHIQHGGEHVVDQVADAQGFAHGAGQRQARRIEGGRVEVSGLDLAVGLGPLR